MTFPTGVVSFTTKRDIKDTIWAEHVNTVQSELTATQTVLGTSILTSNWSGAFVTNTVWGSVADRIANLEFFAGQPPQWVSLSGGSMIVSTLDVPGLIIKHNGFGISSLIEFRNSGGTVVGRVSPDGAETMRTYRATPNASDNGIEIAGPSNYVAFPIYGSKAGAVAWYIDHRGGLVHSAGSFNGGGLVITPGINTEMIRVNATPAQTLPLVNLVTNNVPVFQVNPAGYTSFGAGTGFIVDPTNHAIHFRSSQTRDTDAYIHVTGGSPAAWGDMHVIAHNINIGVDEGLVTIRGRVDMPNMRNVFWTYVPPGGGDDDLYMVQFGDQVWRYPENHLGEAVIAGVTFIAPSSGAVSIQSYARLQAGSNPVALSYSLFQAPSPYSDDSARILNPSINWSIFLNGVEGDPSKNVVSGSMMSMRRIENLVPGVAYSTRLYYQNQNTGATKWKNKNNSQYCLMLRQVGVLVLPEL